MCKDDTIHDLSPFDVTIFLLGDKSGKKRIEVICNNLSDDFVYDIIKGYGPKTIGVFYFVLFRDED